MAKHVPDTAKQAGYHKPRHGDQSCWLVVMDLVTFVGWSLTLMVNPSMKSVFEEGPGGQAAREGQHCNYWIRAAAEYFPANQEENRQWISKKGEPIVRWAHTQADKTVLS